MAGCGRAGSRPTTWHEGGAHILGSAKPMESCAGRMRPALACIAALTCIAMLAHTRAAALDARYVDADGDLVADTPAQTVDPPTLIFAYTPGEDPALYPRVWDGFMRHLEKATGKPIKLFPAPSNTAQI